MNTAYKLAKTRDTFHKNERTYANNNRESLQQVNLINKAYKKDDKGVFKEKVKKECYKCDHYSDVQLDAKKLLMLCLQIQNKTSSKISYQLMMIVGICSWFWEKKNSSTDKRKRKVEKEVVKHKKRKQ